MKLLRVTILLLTLPVFQVLANPQTASANRAWKPFLVAFRTAVKNRDREALSKMMTRDFYYLSSGGDENNNQDTRDEAFDYWETTNIGVWEQLDKVLAKGSVPNTAMREPGSRLPSRVAPPLANNKQAIKQRKFEWYAVFEFRDGQWYCTAFTECCE
jgi:hypothetical protein